MASPFCIHAPDSNRADNVSEEKVFSGVGMTRIGHEEACQWIKSTG
jgi:hypothetical protein